MKILYSQKNVYGNINNYPESPDAVFICALTGRKTMTANDLATCRAHGYPCIQVAAGKADIVIAAG